MHWVNLMNLPTFDMVTRRVGAPLALALLLAGCGDLAAPLDRQPVPGPQRSQFVPAFADSIRSNSGWSQTPWSSGIPTLRQLPTAPALETYQLSFVASRWHASSVTINYLPTEGQRVGAPFLSFYIPRRGLVDGAGGQPLARNDSLTITLTIDPVNFDVDFQPSGVVFASDTPAILTLWYENADPDLNGDGVVDSTDQTWLQQLTFYYQVAGGTTWAKQLTKNDPTMPSVTTALYHFSEYAVSW